LAQRGWHLFPTHAPDGNGGCTCGKSNCDTKNVGKHPATSNGVRDATTDPARIRSWFADSNRNVGVATGPVSGMFVLDVDGLGGELALRRLVAEQGPLPATVTATTGNGVHFYFRWPTTHAIKNAVKVHHTGLDVRADGGVCRGATLTAHPLQRPLCAFMVGKRNVAQMSLGG
jgi:hypothetical protein